MTAASLAAICFDEFGGEAVVHCGQCRRRMHQQCFEK
jgi:hypothetical protein